MSNYTEILNDDLRRQIGLEKFYPFSVMMRGDHAGGVAYTNGGVVALSPTLPSRDSVVLVYLHEVGHLIANGAGIDSDASGRLHNRYFACLVAVMYRRAGLLDRLEIYDFGDTHSRQNGIGGPLPDGRELVERFSYVVTRSAQFAASPLTIERIAEVIFEEDMVSAWRSGHLKQRNTEAATFAWGTLAGAALAMLASVSWWAILA